MGPPTMGVYPELSLSSGPVFGFPAIGRVTFDASPSTAVDQLPEKIFGQLSTGLPRLARCVTLRRIAPPLFS